MKNLLPITAMLVVVACPLNAQQSGDSGPLRIVVAGGEPFVVADSDDGLASGLSLDVWNAVAAQLGVVGEMTTAANVDEAIDRVASGAADLAVGPISITRARAERVRFTQPYFDSTLGIAAPAGGTLLDRFAPFVTTTFLTGAVGLIAVLLLVGTLLWLAERRNNPDQFPSGSSGVGNGIWMALVTMTTVGYGDRVPQTTVGRVITGVWMLVSLVVASSLTAFLATALTLSQMDAATVQSEEQFDENRIAVVAGSTSEAFAVARNARVVVFDTLEAATAGVGAGQADAVVFDRPMLRYLMNQDPQLDLELAPSGYQPQNYGFAASLDGTLASEISLAILALQESGELERIVESWLGSGY